MGIFSLALFHQGGLVIGERDLACRHTYPQNDLIGRLRQYRCSRSTVVTYTP
jgi:hypothetical protein